MSDEPDNEPRGGTCVACGKACESYMNYCDWNCTVALAKANGGATVAPNGLPIACVRADNTMMEHEHADHPTYLFPVTVEGPQNAHDASFGYSRFPETHALIYTDGHVALTLHEYCYATWLLSDSGAWLGGSYWDKACRLSQASVDEIRRRCGEPR